MTSSYVSVSNLLTHELAHFKVPYDVYVYIKQLEHKLNVAEEEIKTMTELLNEAGIYEPW
jgi:hypothetical protein